MTDINRLSVDGSEVQYQIAGEGPVVLFVPSPGFGGWQWAWQFQEIAGPYRAVTYLPSGTRDSDSELRSIQQTTYHIERLLKEENVRHVQLLGFGLGSLVALEYAKRYNRAQSLLLISTPNSPLEEYFDAMRTYAVTANNRDQTAAVTTELTSVSFKQQSPQSFDQLVEWRMQEDPEPSGWADISAVLDDYSRDWPLYEMTLPTQVLRGTNDPIVGRSETVDLTDNLPRGMRTDIKSSGHLPMVERASTVNDLIAGHLEEHTTRELE